MSQMKPTKPYQLWTYTGEGYSFDEFNTIDELKAHIEGGHTYASWFVTRLQNVQLVLADVQEPQAEEHDAKR